MSMPQLPALAKPTLEFSICVCNDCDMEAPIPPTMTACITMMLNMFSPQYLFPTQGSQICKKCTHIKYFRIKTTHLDYGDHGVHAYDDGYVSCAHGEIYGGKVVNGEAHQLQHTQPLSFECKCINMYT